MWAPTAPPWSTASPLSTVLRWVNVCSVVADLSVTGATVVDAGVLDTVVGGASVVAETVEFLDFDSLLHHTATSDSAATTTAAREDMTHLLLCRW